MFSWKVFHVKTGWEREREREMYVLVWGSSSFLVFFGFTFQSWISPRAVSKFFLRRMEACVQIQERTLGSINSKYWGLLMKYLLFCSPCYPLPYEYICRCFLFLRSFCHPWYFFLKFLSPFILILFIIRRRPFFKVRKTFNLFICLLSS